ncbi:MAG: CopG family transcriptional regulator [Burkholderiaceae bacterium]|nr:CopG family transcriptional regulator [Burkholderiaceae bacterium]
MPEELKDRISRLARRAGITTHALIVEAIGEKAREMEQRQEFAEEAESRYSDIVATGKTIPWSEMRSYLEDRAGGIAPRCDD